MERHRGWPTTPTLRIWLHSGHTATRLARRVSLHYRNNRTEALSKECPPPGMTVMTHEATVSCPVEAASQSPRPTYPIGQCLINHLRCRVSHVKWT
ncbi:hypothetical protein PMIN05_012648 [Paraphaeosphaeria minitans]